MINYIQVIMDHLQPDMHPLQDGQHGEQAQMLYLNSEELSSSLFEYYVQLRSDAVPSLSFTLPEQFVKIQKQIISVVELRKNMQKSIQIDAIQAQHFGTIVDLVGQKIKMQQQINKMAEQVKKLETHNIQALVSAQQQQNKTNATNENQILAKSNQLVTQITDLRRSACLLSPSQDHTLILQFQRRSKEEEKYIQQIFNEQREKWKYTKLIYGIKFNELTLREELIEQRETAFHQYEKSNSQLIEVLLREKERDKNLRKKDKQKFEQMLKIRHEIDIENEELSHSQRTLNSHYEVELLRIKDKLNQQQERHNRQIHELNQNIEQLQKQLTKRGRDSKEEQSAIQKRQLALIQELRQLKKINNSMNEQKKQIKSELATQMSKNEHLTYQYQIINKQKIELKIMNDKLLSKNQELLTQFNEAILKNSQNSHIKTQLNQKLENSAKTIQQLESTNEKCKKELYLLKSQCQNSQSQIFSLQSKLQKLQNQLHDRSANLLKSNQYIRQCDSRIAHLQNELTTNFITHNQQTKILQEQLSNKYELITFLSQQIDEYKAQMLLQTESTLPPSINESALQTLKSQVMAELHRSDHIKNTIIDEMVERLNQIIL